MALTIVPGRGHKHTPHCQVCGLRLARPQRTGGATATPATRPPCSTPRPQDWKLVAWMAPDDAAGVIEIQLGMGKGSGGRGRAPLAGDRYTDALRRFANSILLYARDYDAVARGEVPSGLADDDEIPTGPVLAPVPLQPCRSCGELSPWPFCSECEPF